MDKKFLATTALEETWDKTADKIIFLGSHCKLYPRRKKYNSEKYIDLLTLWNSQEKIEHAAKDCEAIFNKKLTQMTEIYNEMFNICENELYYNRVLGLWLLNFINKIYDLYYSLKYAFETHPTLYTSTLNKNKYIIPENFNDYTVRSIDDKYSFQLYSQITKHLNLKSIDINIDVKSENEALPKKISLKEKFLRKISHYLNKIFQNKKIIIASPYFNKNNIEIYIKLLFKSRFKIVFDNMRFDLPTAEEEDSNRDILLKKLNLLQTDSFDNVLNKMISLNIPKIYFEKFLPMRKITTQDTRRDADIYFTANAHYSNEYFKYKVAGNKGAKYLIMQHGGGYGLFKFHSGEYYETRIADKFYSFGWSNKENIKYLAPSKFIYIPKKGDIKDRYNDVLYITSSTSRYVRDFTFFGFLRGGSKELYITKRERFLDSLDKNIKIKLRMYPTDHYKLFEKQRIQDKQYKNVIFDDYKGHFSKTLINCKLHVTDVTQTTFLEALVNNVPTVCFSSILEHETADSAIEAIEKLVQAKILFFDEKKAVEHINNIYPNVDKWWNQKDVQKAKNDFIDKFAKRSDTLENDWVEEFNGILKLNEKK